MTVTKFDSCSEIPANNQSCLFPTQILFHGVHNQLPGIALKAVYAWQEAPPVSSEFQSPFSGKVNFSHLHFSGEVNQSPSVVELTWITFIMAAVVKSPSVPLWKSTTHLQQWSWFQLPSEVKLTSPSVVKSTEHIFISVMKANQAPSAVKMASITFRGEADFTFSGEANWSHLNFHDESQSGTFSSEDGFNQLQRWSWLHCKVNSVIFSAQLCQLRSWRLMLSTSFRASSILIILFHSLLCSTVTYKLVHFWK